MCWNNFSPYVKQTWTVSGVLICIVGCSFQLGYSSILLADVRQPDSPIKVDLNTASWLASCIGITLGVGTLLSSVLMAWIGRRMTLIVCNIPGIVCWLFIYYAQDITVLMFGRALGGVTLGGVSYLGAVFIGECTCPKLRGMYLTLKTTSVCVGALIIHLLGTFLHWKPLALICFVVQTISAVWIAMSPESPHWLASKKRYKESESVFYWLRGRDEQSEREYEELVRNQKDISSRERSGTMLMQAKEFCKKIVRRDFVIPCSIVFVAFLLLECSGRHYFPAYAPLIVEKITGNKSSSAFVYTLGLDLTITSSSIASSILIRKMKRRTLLFSTGIAATVVLFMACLYLFLIAKGWIPDKFSWVALCLFVPYFALVNLGSTPIPLAMLGEIFPMEHRTAGSLVSGGIISFGMWASIKAPPYMLANTNVYGTFFIFGVLQVIALFILYLILPETKDRTLEEIEYYFNKRCFKDAAATADEHKPLGARLTDKLNV